MLPPPRAIVAPPPLATLTAFFTLLRNALGSSPPLVGAPEILVIELVISLPAPNTKEPLELLVLFATPTILLAIPAYLELELADSMLFNAPVIVEPKFLVSFPDDAEYLEEAIEYEPTTEENKPLE